MTRETYVQYTRLLNPMFNHFAVDCNQVAAVVYVTCYQDCLYCWLGAARKLCEFSRCHGAIRIR